MNVDEAAEPEVPPARRGRSRLTMITVALLTLAGLAGAASWTLARTDWWLTPIQEAERDLAAGDLPRAGLLISRLIQDDPRRTDARLLYARFLRLSGQSREADAALGKAMDLGVPEASLWREYGLLLADPEFRKAEPILLKSLKANPGDAEVLRAIANGYSRQGRWPDAAGFYARWLRIEPERTEALMGRSRALVQSGQSREAVTELRSILARQPDDYDARLLLANCFLSNAAIREAEPELDRCRELRPERSEPLAGLAACAVERDDLDRARDLLDRAVTLDPSSLVALSARANLALNRRQYDTARADFERIVELDPRNKLGHMHLAQLYHRAGDPARAGEHEQAYRALQAEQEEQFRVIRGIH